MSRMLRELRPKKELCKDNRIRHSVSTFVSGPNCLTARWQNHDAKRLDAVEEGATQEIEESVAFAIKDQFFLQYNTAAAKLEQVGISAEVIDVCTQRPIDIKTIMGC